MPRRTLQLLARLTFWLAATIAYVAAVVPGDPALVANDKANHMLAFGTLSVLARIGWPRGRTAAIAAWLIGFGALIELNQALPIVARDASWLDLCTDAIAVLVGLAVGGLVLRLLRRG